MEAVALRATLDLVLFVIDVDQVPRVVGRCLELVRFFHADVQRLIELRNEHIEILQKRHIKELEHVNSTIESANRSLVDVCKIVEKCRPTTYNGRTGFRARLRWMWLDSNEFQAQQPIIMYRHNAVTAELIALRNLGLMAAVVDIAERTRAEEERVMQDRMAAREFENLDLLGGFLGDSGSAEGQRSPDSIARSRKSSTAGSPALDANQSQPLLLPGARPSLASPFSRQTSQPPPYSDRDSWRLSQTPGVNPQIRRKEVPNSRSAAMPSALSPSSRRDTLLLQPQKAPMTPPDDDAGLLALFSDLTTGTFPPMKTPGSNVGALLSSDKPIYANDITPPASPTPTHSSQGGSVFGPIYSLTTKGLQDGAQHTPGQYPGSPGLLENSGQPTLATYGSPARPASHMQWQPPWPQRTQSNPQGLSLPATQDSTESNQLLIQIEQNEGVLPRSSGSTRRPQTILLDPSVLSQVRMPPSQSNLLFLQQLRDPNPQVQSPAYPDLLTGILQSQELAPPLNTSPPTQIATVLAAAPQAPTSQTRQPQEVKPIQEPIHLGNPVLLPTASEQLLTTFGSYNYQQRAKPEIPSVVNTGDSQGGSTAYGQHALTHPGPTEMPVPADTGGSLGITSSLGPRQLLAPPVHGLGTAFSAGSHVVDIQSNAAQSVASAHVQFESAKASQPPSTAPQDMIYPQLGPIQGNYVGAPRSQTPLPLPTWGQPRNPLSYAAQSPLPAASSQGTRPAAYQQSARGQSFGIMSQPLLQQAPSGSTSGRVNLSAAPPPPWVVTTEEAALLGQLLGNNPSSQAEPPAELDTRSVSAADKELVELEA